MGVSILLFLLSVAAAIGIPAVQRAQRSSRARAVLAELRQFETAFQAYAHGHGDWPAGTAAPGTFPPEMEATLSATDWTKTTPIGGRYIWLTDTLQRGERSRAAIAIVTADGQRVSDDKRQLDELLRQATESGLESHRLRLGFRNEPVYILEH